MQEKNRAREMQERNRVREGCGRKAERERGVSIISDGSGVTVLSHFKAAEREKQQVQVLKVSLLCE